MSQAHLYFGAEYYFGGRTVGHLCINTVGSVDASDLGPDIDAPLVEN